LKELNKQVSAAVPHASPELALAEMSPEAGLEPLHLRAVVNARHGKRYAGDAVLYREREGGDRVFLIRGGMVKLLSHLPNGHTRIVRLHKAGQWLGLERLLGQPCSHTAIAIGDVQVDDFPVESLMQLHSRNMDVLGQLLWQWHRDLAQADKWISEFSTGPIKSRVARLLLYLAELEHGPDARTVELLSVHEMAEILGVTQESVSRILAGFKRDNTLKRVGRRPAETFLINARDLKTEAGA